MCGEGGAAGGVMEKPASLPMEGWSRREGVPGMAMRSASPEQALRRAPVVMSMGPTILDESGRRRLRDLEGKVSSLGDDLADAMAAQERANRALRCKDGESRCLKADLERERDSHKRTRDMAEELAKAVGNLKGTVQERASELAARQAQKEVEEMKVGAAALPSSHLPFQTTRCLAAKGMH